MTGQEQQSQQHLDAVASQGVDPDELSRRIGEALQPTFNEISDRVADVVAETLADTQPRTAGARPESKGPEEETPQRGEPEPSNGGDDDDEASWFEKARGSLASSFIGAMRDEGGDQLEHLVENGVDLLFSRRAQGWVRNLADDALQAGLYDALSSIDDPNERYQLYRDNLSKLRPIVRDAVTSMYTEDARDALKREARGAIPSLLHGEYDTAFSTLIDALSQMVDNAEGALSGNSQELLQVFQQTSTTLLQESMEDTADDKIDPEKIQRELQGKIEEARESLTERIGGLQEGASGVQSQLQERLGARSGPGRQGAAPSGLPPNGFPPSGLPPFGMPPSGKPPSGAPPSGQHPSGSPPSGLPPEVERRRRERESRSRQRAGR